MKYEGAIRSHHQLTVFQTAFASAMRVFDASKGFPIEERYSLTDQIRRSSRSVGANIAEAWRKRRYRAAFIAKLSDAEAEAAETQVWIEFAAKCRYIDADTARSLYLSYDEVLAALVRMIHRPDPWLLKPDPG